MDNHDHDLEIVAALAEGRSTEPDRAHELVRTCPVCAQAYRDHRTVLEAIARDPVPQLDERERLGLRSSVWGDLDLDSAPAPPTTRPARSPWWYRLAPVAAALVVVVGIAVVLPRGGDDSAEVAGTDAFDTAASDLQTESDDGEAATGDGDEALADDGADREAAEEAAPATTEAMTETTRAAEESGDVGAGAQAPPIVTTLEEIEQAQRAFAERAGERREPMTPIPEVTACLESVGPDVAGPLLAWQDGSVDDREALFVAVGRPGAVARVVVFESETCVVIASLEP